MLVMPRVPNLSSRPLRYIDNNMRLNCMGCRGVPTTIKTDAQPSAPPPGMMRRLLLFLSDQQRVRHWMETSTIARRFANRFVAGDILDDALAACRRVNAEHITATLDYLGEHVRTLDEAALCRDAYLRTLRAIVDNRVDSNVSLKLTQFGIDLSEDVCRANVAALVRCAAQAGSFVRIDMESTAYTDRTLRLVEFMHENYGACGTVIQAYLHRSARDFLLLCVKGIRVRLCKGAYLEP